MSDDVKVQKIMHKGVHVASIHTFKGRGGGMTSGTHNPDGSPAHKKYGIDPFDTKREQIKKIKDYHKNVKESNMKSFGAFVAESQEINEAADVELKPHENGTHYIVHKIHPKSGIESDQLKKGEKISDSHVDDLHDMGYKVKIHSGK